MYDVREDLLLQSFVISLKGKLNWSYMTIPHISEQIDIITFNLRGHWRSKLQKLSSERHCMHEYLTLEVIGDINGGQK